MLLLVPEHIRRDLQVSAHYIVVLDTSGSMSSQDCCGQDGTWQRRIDAAASLNFLRMRVVSVLP